MKDQSLAKILVLFFPKDSAENLLVENQLPDANLAAMVQRQNTEIQDLIVWCKEHLPESSIPQFIRERTEIPQSFQGKCERKAVERILQEHFGHRPGVPAESMRAEVVPNQRAELIGALWRQANHLRLDGAKFGWHFAWATHCTGMNDHTKCIKSSIPDPDQFPFLLVD